MKRKRLSSLLVLLLSGWTFASTTTLTGTIKDAQGNPLNGTLVMRLPVPAQDAMTNTAVMPSPVTYNVLNGVIQGGAILPLYDVATLQPQGLYYIARAYDTAGNLQFYGNYVVTGGSFNLGAATPTSVTTSNVSYVLPIFPNQPNNFTAAQTFTAVLSATSPDASSGFLRMANSDLQCWRNSGNSADICSGYTNINGNDFLTIGGAVLGSQSSTAILQSVNNGGLLLQTTNTSGAGPAITLQPAQGTAGSNGGNVLLIPGLKGLGAANGTVKIFHGMNGANGFQHVRTASCTTGAGAGSTCNTTVSWGQTFDDTSYTAACTVSGGTGAVTGTPYILNTSSKSATQITVTIANLTAVASSGTLDCIGVHD